MDDVMLPGFRFHPTDEELVGFYLKKKIQQRSLPIELIKQVDIYKYDPWDLPNLAPTGEKEWYFYCPRDRKYRNSARPNRVTGAGFWKATGTDRPIYSSDGSNSNCIGLKKSLVFYRGRAAKGIKTDWMMHEFRLPAASVSQSQSSPSKKISDKSQLPPNDAWAICRIFKKTTSMAQRALSHSWVPEHTKLTSDLFTAESFSALDIPMINQTATKLPPFSIPHMGFPSGFMFSTIDISGPTARTTSADSPVSLFNLDPDLVAEANKISESIGLIREPQQLNDHFSMKSPQDNMPAGNIGEQQLTLTNHDHEWVKVRTVSEFPFSQPSTILDDWNLNMPWDSPAYSTNKCYN